DLHATRCLSRRRLCPHASPKAAGCLASTNGGGKLMQARRLIDPSIIVAALALGAYLVVTAHHPSQTELDARPNNVLPAFEPLDMAGLRWEGPEGFRLVRDPEAGETTRYSLGQPGGREVNQDVVREVLSALDLAVWKRKLGELPQTPAAELGFDKPRLEFRIEA